MEVFIFHLWLHTGWRILVLVSHILFKWTIYIRNKLSIISATVWSMKNSGYWFDWVWGSSNKPFLTKQLEFYCFFTFLKWLSYQVSSHMSNQHAILYFIFPSKHRILNCKLKLNCDTFNYLILSFLFTNSLIAIRNNI